MTKPRLITDAEIVEQELGSSISSITNSTLNLQRGLNTVTVDRNTPFNVLNIDGRTLVNLFGRDGNCEDISKWSGYGGTLTKDTANFVYGTSSIKITATVANQGVAFSGATVPLKTGKYYIIISEIKNGNDTYGGRLAYSGVGTTTYTADTGKFVIRYLKANPATDLASKIEIQSGGVLNQYVYYDGVRVYEVTQAEYSAIDAMTTDQINAKYPYVDDVKHLQNPYLIKSGRNLLPPFQEWTLASTSKIIDSYKIQHDSVSAGEQNWVIIPITANQSYTFSATSYGGKLNVTALDINQLTISTIVDETSAQKTFITPNNTAFIKFYLYSAIGTFIYDKPMLNIGSTALPFEPQNNDYLFLNTTLASGTLGVVKDYIYYKDANYYKSKRFITDMALDGSLSWQFYGDMTGYKYVYTSPNSFTPANASEHFITKYDGKPISYNSGLNIIDSFRFQDANYGTLAITIADTDSGWGETYTPTADEIKAYFWGWRMFQEAQSSQTSLYTSGTKWWWNSVTGATTNITPTAYVGTSYTPYKLTYQLANEQEELIQFEGDIQLHSGMNQIEIGEGVVIREKANPKMHSSGSWYMINHTGTAGTTLRNKVDRLISIYKNGRIDTNWQKETTVNSYGKQDTFINTPLYDSSAEYTVTYIVLDKYAQMSSVNSGIGNYNTSLKSIMNNVSQELTDLTTKQSVTDVRLDKTFVKGLGERIESGTFTIPSTSSIFANYTAMGTTNFSRSFSSKPVIYAWCPDGQSGNNGYPILIAPALITTTSFSIYACDGSGKSGINATPMTLDANKTVYWIAIGT